MQEKSVKPLEVLIFVIFTAIISASLGIGILRYNLACYNLLLYFSSIIIISKILVFGNIITLNGALETTIPAGVKKIISILYHSAIIIYFSSQPIRKLFKARTL